METAIYILPIFIIHYFVGFPIGKDTLIVAGKIDIIRK